MLTTATVILALIVGVLLLRLRLRFELSDDHRLLFVGLGRSGSELDFALNRGVVKLFGRTIKQFTLEKGDQGVKEKPESRKGTEAQGEKATAAKSGRRVDIRGWLDILPQCLKALGRYTVNLVKAAVVEQAEGEIEAGFDTPDITGQVFGYYQAALAAAPSLVGRVRYTPVWTEASFSAAMRICVALPLYQLLWQTLVLAWRLPKVRLYKLIRGDRKGVQDGKQRS